MAFIPVENAAGMTVNHIDDDGFNNHVSNLEWRTVQENSRLAAATGAVNNTGSRHGQAKLTEADVVEIRRLYAAGGVTLKQLGEAYGMSQHTIGQITRREKWKHV